MRTLATGRTTPMRVAARLRALGRYHSFVLFAFLVALALFGRAISGVGYNPAVSAELHGVRSSLWRRTIEVLGDEYVFDSQDPPVRVHRIAGK